MTHGGLKDYIRELQQATNKITDWLSELEERALEIDYFFRKGNLLQAAHTLEEACAVITELAKQLFPTEAGALYLRASGQGQESFEPVAVWPGSRREIKDFELDDCWALKSGRLHFVDGASHGPVCKHVHHSSLSSYLCVPMIAFGEALGVLYLRSPHGRGQATANGDRLPEAKQQLAAAVAGHIALAIANMRLHEELNNQVIRDPLTGLFNRRYLDEALARELRRADRRRADRHESPVGIIMLDIDHFKRFNTDYTHPGGDALLRALGKFLGENFCRREGDFACRYGGEEFALVMPGASLEDTRRRAEQLRKEVKRLKVRYEESFLRPVSLSLGVAAYPSHGLAPEVLSKAAATALMQAKKGGRDRVVVAKLTTKRKGRPR
jgi:diguanylate cyclase (GGDEF)-like protein